MRGRVTRPKFAVVSALLMFVGCNSGNGPPSRAEDQAAIRKLDADWVKAAQSKRVDAWMAFYSDNAVVLPPNDKLATTRNAIRKPVGELLGLPGLAITWQPSKIEVARSGDLAYLYGTYEYSFNESVDRRTRDVGKILEIWKKQTDGSWRCIVDTWNSDLPAVPLTMPK